MATLLHPTVRTLLRLGSQILVAEIFNDHSGGITRSAACESSGASFPIHC